MSVAEFLALQGCTIGQPPPAVSPSVIASGAHDGASAEELNTGRALFVRRCNDCHLLPQVAAHNGKEWRVLLAKMGRRAHLSTEEREAVLAYLTAARATL